MLKPSLCWWQERDAEVQGLQQRLAEAEEAHKSELVDMQATIQTSRTKLQDTKVVALLSPSMFSFKLPRHYPRIACMQGTCASYPSSHNCTFSCIGNDW